MYSERKNVDQVKRDSLSDVPHLDFTASPDLVHVSSEIRQVGDTSSISSPSSNHTDDLDTIPIITPRSVAEEKVPHYPPQGQLKSQNKIGKAIGFTLAASAISAGTYFSANFLMEAFNKASKLADDNAHIPQDITRIFLGTVALSVIVGAVNLSMVAGSKIQEKLLETKNSFSFKNLFDKSKDTENENLLSPDNA